MLMTAVALLAGSVLVAMLWYKPPGDTGPAVVLLACLWGLLGLLLGSGAFWPAIYVGGACLLAYLVSIAHQAWGKNWATLTAVSSTVGQSAAFGSVLGALAVIVLAF